jgi:hypothetical protein
MIYLVIGNHQTLSGVWEQLEITLRTFREMGLNIHVCSRIKPGATNILIEDFNSYIVEEILRVKIENPKTKYILYVTEYLTQTTSKRVSLNCFNALTAAVRAIFKLEYKYLGDTYNQYRNGSAASRFQGRVRSVIEPILAFFANQAGSSYGNELMMARREACLDRVRGLFSLCISTTEAVLNGYDIYCDCPLKYLPVFVDTNRVKSNREKAHKYPAIFFSGRMTVYRKAISKDIGLHLLNGYPLEGGTAWNNLAKETTFKLDRLEKEESDTFRAVEAKRFADEIRQIELPAFEVITSDIYSYAAQSKNAAYEIYIPQSEAWPYSSPNRTILSIESGFIPIDYGDFSDHDINEIALKATNNNMLKNIVATPLALSYKELDIRIDHYNKGQHVKVVAVKNAILKLDE